MVIRGEEVIMNKDYYFNVKCKNEECFNDKTKYLHCEKCDEGRLYIHCPCGKETQIDRSLVYRFECECGLMVIPCGINKYNLIKDD